MIKDTYLHEEWECHECDKSGMTAREFRNHTIEQHPESSHFTDMYPAYYVCECADGEYTQDVYMLAVKENGPYYMAYEKSEYVDEMHPWELYRHDWEYVLREETPFPEYEA